MYEIVIRQWLNCASVKVTEAKEPQGKVNDTPQDVLRCCLAVSWMCSNFITLIRGGHKLCEVQMEVSRYYEFHLNAPTSKFL